MEKGGQRLRNEVIEGAGHSQKCQVPLVSDPVPVSGITNKKSSQGPCPSQVQSSVTAPQRPDLTVNALSFLSKAMMLDVGRTRPLTLLWENSRTTQGGWAKTPVT